MNLNKFSRENLYTQENRVSFFKSEINQLYLVRFTFKQHICLIRVVLKISHRLLTLISMSKSVLQT